MPPDDNLLVALDGTSTRIGRTLRWAGSFLPIRYHDPLVQHIASSLPPSMQRWMEPLIGIPIPSYVRSKPILFIHIPKNAGTSIAQALYGRSIAHRPAKFYAASDPEWFGRIEKFAVTRNPWDRLVSAYNFATNGGPGARMIDPSFLKLVRRYASFRDFVFDYLLPHRNQLHTLDQMLRPQCHYVFSDAGDCLVDKLFRLEDLSLLEQYLRTHGVTFSQSVVLNPSTREAEYRSYYDAALATAVGSLYDADVERFGYRY